MTAISAASGRGVRERSIKFLQLVLATGVTVFPGSAIFWDPVAGKATNAAAQGNRFLGLYTGQPQGKATGSFLGDGTTKINVDLLRQVDLVYFVNGTSGDAVAATDFLNTAFQLDDQTVSIKATAHAPIGTIWDIDTRFGIGVEKFAQAGNGLSPVLVPGAFAAGAMAPASIVSGATYDIPTMAANSTLTLPAAAPDGTFATFTADGVKNGFTLQYVDATGTVNLTAALTASKRHVVEVVKAGGVWRAVSGVSP